MEPHVKCFRCHHASLAAGSANWVFCWIFFQFRDVRHGCETFLEKENDDDDTGR